MPPMPTWYRGRDPVADFLGAAGRAAFAGAWSRPRERADGFRDLPLGRTDESFMPHGVSVVTLHDSRIAEVTTFLDPAAFGRFDLPAILPGSGNNS